ISYWQYSCYEVISILRTAASIMRSRTAPTSIPAIGQAKARLMHASPETLPTTAPAEPTNISNAGTKAYDVQIAVAIFEPSLDLHDFDMPLPIKRPPIEPSAEAIT